MIFYLVHFFKTIGIHVPSVFLYFSTRIFLASLSALLLSIFLGPWFISKLYSLKIGDRVERKDCPLLEKLHAQKENTPTMGGVLILFSVLLSSFFWMDLKHPFTLILFLTTLVLGFLGGIDDFFKLKYKNTKGLSVRNKFLVQIVFAFLVSLYLLIPSISENIHYKKWFNPPIIKEKEEVLSLKSYASRIYLPFFKDPFLTVSKVFFPLLALFFIFVIVGSSNAVNLTDGLDGLAAGSVIMTVSCLIIFGFVSNHMEIAKYLNILYVEGSGEIAVFLSAVLGACLGFLWYNGYPAQVFMGDTGSLALGGIIGVSSVLLRREFLLAIVGGVFVVEALSVIIQVLGCKIRGKDKRVFLCTPLHHHFEYKGLPEPKIVLRFWIVGFLLALIGIASLKFQ